MSLTLLPFLTAGAPEPDPTAVVRALRDHDMAVLRVGERLAIAGAAFCSDSGRSAGMVVQQASQYGAAFRMAAEAEMGVGARPTITMVAPDGAAAAAGLRPGDQITSIDGHAFADAWPTESRASFAAIAAAHDAIDTAMADGRAELRVIRAGYPMTLVLVPRSACRARFDVRAGRSNNASSDGLYVQVSSDLVDQVRSDGELAAVLAHEMAHNILEHPKQLKAVGRHPKMRATEIEADRLSVYLLDAAGYTLSDATGFWARWGRANDYGIFSDRTHPGWKQRIATIEREAAMIAAQRTAGQPVRAPADLRPRD